MEKKPDQIVFSSPVPYYAQLVQILRDKIQVGLWKPGEKITGEEELCREYSVSRTVVRQAFLELELQGLIRRRKGKGTFVSEPKINESLVQKLTGFHQDMVERGLQPQSVVLHQKITPASPLVAKFLQVPEDSEVVDINRLRLVNQEPIQLVNTYIPYDLCPGLLKVDLSRRSLYEFLQSQCQIEIVRGRRYIEAVSADEQTARWLQVKKGSAVILLDSVSYLEDGRPLEYYRAFHRGDRTRFEVELVRTQADIPGRFSDEQVESLPNSEGFFKHHKS